MVVDVVVVDVVVVDAAVAGAALLVDVVPGTEVEVDAAESLSVAADDEVEGDEVVTDGAQADNNALSVNSVTVTTFEGRSRRTGPERTVGRYALADGKWRSLASAPALGAGGRGFESRLPDGWPWPSERNAEIAFRPTPLADVEPVCPVGLVKPSGSIVAKE